ncbi:MAG: cation:proton antiporter [Candidatus Peribacteria bacterium]|nr:MAG: cation:proton antiporter [Candidatus Peribacteria bacterium]
MTELLTTYLTTHPLAEFALILLVMLIVGYIMKLLRQPSIVGYIVAGILLSPQLHGLVQAQESVDLFAHIGIALLLFLVGLGLSARIIREVGRIAVVTGIGQVVFTTLVGMGIAMLLGNDRLTALILGV